MINVALVTTIPQRLNDPIDDPNLGFQFAQKENTTITCGHPAVKIRYELLARNACKRQSCLFTFHRGSPRKCLLLCTTLT